jgi:hypothetical protein
MHRAVTAPWRKKFLDTAATVAGRLSARALRTGPGILGAGLITVAAGGWHWQLACLVGGIFLLIVDHRTPL